MKVLGWWFVNDSQCNDCTHCCHIYLGLGGTFKVFSWSSLCSFVGILLWGLELHIIDELTWIFQDNKDLYAEEAAAQREAERRRMLSIPGLVAPIELQDEMVDM